MVARAAPPPDGVVYLRFMDALSRILQSVRLKSSILSVAELSPPFGVRTRGVDDGAAIFHAVVAGRAELVTEGRTASLATGDVAVLTRGQGHDLADPPETPPAPLTSLPRIDGPVPIVRSARGTPTTRIVCGVFRLDHAASRSLLSLLPEVLVHQGASADPESQEWVAATVKLLDLELRRGADGAGAVAARLCDVLFVQLLRGGRLRTQGWLAALADPHIGNALALIHEDPRTRWDAAVLAERVGMSRTRFFARFSELVGEPPAQYLARWRMVVAADRLGREDLSVMELAERCGYGSEDAFVRVFKRHFGVTPSAYRRAQASPAAQA